MALNKDTKTTIKAYNMVIQFIIETFVGMGIGFFLGRYLDGLLFEDRQILMFVLMFFGIFAAFVNFIKKALKTIDGGKDNEEK